MNQHERWHRLLEMVAASGRLTIEGSAAELGVSPATIRRDFDELATQQLVTRTRGGVIAAGVSYDLPLRYKAVRQAPEKLRIAAAAAALIPAHATVGLNGGTTTTEVARALALRAEPEDQTAAVTVVTNALNIANELIVRPHIRVVVTGGAARPQSYELVGRVAETMVAAVALDLVILGVDAIDHQHGASAHHDGEAAINQVMVTSAARTIVVADSSKLGRRTFNRICPLGNVDTLVTDQGADPDQVSLIEQAGVEVLLA